MQAETCRRIIGSCRCVFETTRVADRPNRHCKICENALKQIQTDCTFSFGTIYPWRYFYDSGPCAGRCLPAACELAAEAQAVLHRTSDGCFLQKTTARTYVCRSEPLFHAAPFVSQLQRCKGSAVKAPYPSSVRKNRSCRFAPISAAFPFCQFRRRNPSDCRSCRQPDGRE